jgi:hypothetical protein
MLRIYYILHTSDIVIIEGVAIGQWRLGGKDGGSGNAEGGVKRRWGAAGWGRLGVAYGP